MIIVLGVMTVVGVNNPQLVPGATILVILLIEVVALIISFAFWVIKKIRKIKKEVTAEAGGKGTPYPTAIFTVHMKDGKTYPCRVQTRKGSPAYPLSAEEIKDKFMDCAQLNYSANQSRRILEAVMDIEKTEDIGNVIQLF